jgi:O-antigen/teichoic acid export membrane protein
LFVYAAALVAGMLLSRGLGPVGRGELAAVVLWGSLAFDIGALGTPNAVAYFAAAAGPGRPNPGLAIMRLGYPILSGVAVAVFFVLVIGSGDAVKPSGSVIAITVVWIPLLFAFGLLTRNAQGHGRMTLFNTARLISGVGAPLGIAVLAAAAALTVQSAMVTYALALAGAVAVVLLRNRADASADRTMQVERKTRKRFWNYSLWSAASILAVKGNRSFDLLLLSLLGAAADLGWYTVAATSALTVAIIGESLGMHAFERVAREPQTKARYALVRRYLGATLGLSVAVGAAFWVLAPWLVPLVYGSDFVPSVTPARYLIFGGLAVSTSRLLGSVLNALGKPRAVAVSEFLGAAATLIGLLIWGVDSLSVVAAVAVAGYAVTAVIEILLIDRALRRGSDVVRAEA